MGKRQYAKIGKKKRINKAKKESLLFIDCSKYVGSIKVICYISEKYKVKANKLKIYTNRPICRDTENDTYMKLPLNKKFFVHLIGNGLKSKIDLKIELCNTNKTYYEIEEVL
ncbi:hypothetical protein PDN61_29310 [Bacillus cereus]|nr:hypothetical protein [Bacillus cereus]MDA2497467.1 hypothetical protein [Bacillus cereus]